MPGAAVVIDRVRHFAGGGAFRTELLHDVSAEVRAGEVVLLTGPSGSGKTTLLTLVGGLRAVEEGSLRVLGHELRGAAEAVRIAVRRQIGHVFQHPNLLRALTALQNVETGLHAGAARAGRARSLARDALRRVGLAREADRRPRELSVGQRQRVAVARALVARPRLVLADEPTAALDRRSGREVIGCLCRLARESGAAGLVVTHDDRIFDVADRVLWMEEGRLGELPAAERAAGVGG
jgi:putative ABC transport system ATP-binding protein